MRRGSIQTWEPLARRESANMAQFASSRSEFMTSDLGLNDIEYERKGGFFMSHRKTAVVTLAVLVIVIAAGFVGAYIGTIPKEKNYDTFEMIDADVGCDNVETSKFSLSNSIWPSHYGIKLSPIIEDRPVSRLRGRVTIEFHCNGTERSNVLVLNAHQLNVTKAHLTCRVNEKSEVVESREKRNAPTPYEVQVSSKAQTNNGNEINEQTEAINNDSEIGEDGRNTRDLNGTSSNSTVGDISNSTTTNSTNSTVETSSVSKNESHILIKKIEMDHRFLVLHLEKPMTVGDYYLEIDYEVPINDYVDPPMNKSDEKWSAIRSIELRRFFPVFDDVKKKARFSVNVPRSGTTKIYSNMPPRFSNITEEGWVQDTFEETPLISPHNLALVGSKNLENLGKRTIENTTIYFWDGSSKPEVAMYLMDMIEPVITNLTDLFGVPLPISKLDVIGLQHSDYSAAYPGLILIQESLYNVNRESPRVTKELALMNLIKLIGKQWLGGLVNEDNYADSWIIESSLLYIQHHLMAEIENTHNYSTFVMDVQPKVLEVDGYSVSRSLRSKLDPSHSNAFFAAEAYAMGACLIRMLHGALRHTEFRQGFRTFVSRWSGANANAASFWEAMTVNSTVADERPEGEANLAEIMNLWNTEDGYPVVTVTRNYETGSAIVRQARFSYDKPLTPNKQLWHIPLTWISGENQTQPALKWMKNEVETTLQLNSTTDVASFNETWVVFHPSRSGHYRVNYDEENWRVLADALRENHETFSPSTRAALIDDVFSLGFVRSIPYSVVFDVIDYLSEKERDPEPWTYLLQHAVKLNLVLYDSPEYFDYQGLMARTLSRLWDKEGRRVTEGSRLTLIAHQLACMFDHSDYLTWAKESYAGFESYPLLPIKIDVPSYLHDTLLCAFAKLNHELGWQWWQQKFANVTNRVERNALLSSLACFQVPSMLQAVLNEIVYSKNFEEDDALVILKSFSVYPAAAQTALKFVQSNWRNISSRYTESCRISSAFLDASSTGFTAENDIEDFKSFRDKNYNSLKKIGYTTALLEAKARSYVSFLATLPDNPIPKNNKTTTV